MSDIQMTHLYSCDLADGPREVKMANALMHQDACADVFRIHVTRKANDLQLTGMTVRAYMYFAATRETMLLTGVAEGSAALVTLPPECYQWPGYASLAIQLQQGDIYRTLIKIDMTITRTGSENLFAPGGSTTLAELIARIEALEKGGSGGSVSVPEDKAAIVADVLAILDTSAAAHVVVDADKNITLSGDLADGAYTLKYLNEDGSTTTICTLTISGSTGEGSGGSGDTGDDDSGETDDPVVTPTGNLFVANTCTLNKRINSSGELRDQDQTFVTDYIDIGDCMAKGGINQLHFRGFIMYKARSDGSDGAINIGIGGFYRGINYYDDNNNFLGQNVNVYVEDFVADEHGDGVITLDTTKTTATKIRVCGVIASADLTSTDQLSSCIVTLNELIPDANGNGSGSSSGTGGPDVPPAPTYTNLVPTSKAHTDLSTVFNGVGYQNGKYASSSSPYIGDDAATVCTGVIKAQGGSVFYIKGITLDGSNNHNRIGFARGNANGTISIHHVKSVTEQGGMATLETLGNQYYKLTINEGYFSANFPTLEYIWISGIGTGANLIITANEPIE